MAYTILVNNDNSLMTTRKERIMQRSKLVDDLCFLVPKLYNGLDMSEYTVNLEYLLPCSRKYCSEILRLSDEAYTNHLKYLLPFDTKFTTEAGAIEAQLTFLKVDLDEEGNDVQRVRKTTTCKIMITPISAWSDIIPDSALTALDERIIKQDAQIRALAELATAFEGEMIDNLVYDEIDETLQLSANGVGVGDKVSISRAIDKAIDNELEDGLPVVDFNSEHDPILPDDPNEDSDNNVIEF